MQALRLGLLLAGIVAAPVQADVGPRGEATFELCRERVQAVSLEESDGEMAVYVRLTESAAQALAERAPAGRPVDVRAGRERFTRFVVREALRARPPRTIQSTPGSASRARALERALRQPCAPTASR